MKQLNTRPSRMIWWLIVSWSHWLSMKIWTPFTRPWKFLPSTCSDTSLAGVPIGRSLTIQKAVSMRITWETLEDLLKYSNMLPRIARLWEITTLSLAGKCALEVSCATSVTRPWKDSTILTSTRESIVTDQDATSQRFVLSTILNRRVSMLKRWPKIIESRLKINSTLSTLSKSMLPLEINIKHQKDLLKSNRLLSIQNLSKFRIIIFLSPMSRKNNRILRTRFIKEIAFLLLCSHL